MHTQFSLILTALCLSTCLQASQVVQKETAQQQEQATPLASRMNDDAFYGSLTKETLQQYLKQNADINAKNEWGSTALIVASCQGHTAVVQQLIAAGADINAKNEWSNTALIEASYYDRRAVVQQLIAAGADVNAKNNDGYTALMRASRNGHTAVVQQLIAAGADQTIVNEKNKNKTARDCAKDKDAYDKAVAAGLIERQKLLEQQMQTIGESTSLIPDLCQIAAEYSFGPVPRETDNEEKTPDDSAKK